MEDTGEWVSQLYQEIGPALLVFLRRKLPDRLAAEDTLQETFVAALRHPERVKAAVSPRAYLFGVARNLANTALRRCPVGEPLPPDLAVEETASVDPRIEEMGEAIARLKPALSEVLELRLQHELSYEEIANALDLPVGTVRSRLHHAVSELREAMRRLGSPTV